MKISKLKTCPGQVKFESWLSEGPAGIKAFFEPCITRINPSPRVQVHVLEEMVAYICFLHISVSFFMIKSFSCFQELCFKGILIHLAKDISITCLKIKPLVSLRGFRHQENWLAKRMTLPAWFNHLEESFSYKEVQFKKFCTSVKTSCPPAENVNETPVQCNTAILKFFLAT